MHRQERFAGGKQGEGTWVWLATTWGFALLSGFLCVHGIGTTSPPGALQRPVVDSAKFYVWSMLDAIPVLDLPRTIGWDLGFRFTDHVNPVLLLLYKLVVIIPAIETGRLIWRKRPGPVASPRS